MTWIVAVSAAALFTWGLGTFRNFVYRRAFQAGRFDGMRSVKIRAFMRKENSGPLDVVVIDGYLVRLCQDTGGPYVCDWTTGGLEVTVTPTADLRMLGHVR